MGACISVHDHKASSAMKVVQGSLDHKPAVIHSTYSNRKLPVMDGLVAVKPQLPPSQSLPTYSDYGSKEETFYDSQAWLDSDCEDEFMSVNGEFTPSRGNTPVHHSLIPSRANGLAQPLPTPIVKRKKLLDLFKESIRENNHSSSNYDEPLNKCGLTLKKERHTGSMHGCFTSLLYVRGTGSQKKSSVGCS
ncbi:uncharacterized protein At3g27210-like [Bidens hawaiensis]|uniref:uncharacterized protein At3g27210-like n=1 Tax=Bidens hawaiensis TaxID=980011 RepID=UPI004049F0F4